MRRFVPILLLLLAHLGGAQAEALSHASPGLMCRAAIAAAEQAGAIPAQLMAAIGRVESGRLDPATGKLNPWPWTIDAEGQGSFFDTKDQAIAAVRALQARGIRSIDVGCMQVNLLHHPDAFASLEAAFDPGVNTTYAASLLNQLHGQSNDWARAVALYHSATPDLAADYQRKVFAAWPDERRLAGNSSMLAQAFPGGAGTARAGALLHTGLPATMARAPMVSGRGLAAYRRAPILLATRPPRGVGG